MHTTTPIDGVFTSLHDIIGTQMEPSRSIHNITRAGELLGISPRVVDDIINPQDVHVFRLHTNMLGKPVSVWGCTSFHSRARGIYKGGIRISPDVHIWETIELSRLMTLKTALTDLELGGAKTGINFDVRRMYPVFGKDAYDRDFERHLKRSIMKEYAHHYRGMLEKRRYVPAPDLGSGPDEMVAIYNETHEPSSVTGKPEGISGWLPGRAEATGFGAFSIIRRLISQLGRHPDDIRVSIHGFGNVGSHTALFLHQLGIRVVAVVDLGGGVSAEEGLDIPALVLHAKTYGSVHGFSDAITSEAFFRLPVDFFVPAAINDSVTSDIAGELRAAYVIEGANYPVTLPALQILQQRGITVVPDIIANAGGVIASAEEYLRPVSSTKIAKERIYEIIDDKIDANLQLAFSQAAHYGISLDLACSLVAVERVYRTMRQQGWV